MNWPTHIPKKICELFETEEPAALGPEIRSSRLPLNILQQRLELIAPQAVLTRSLLFLWHDHLEASHELSQNLANPDGSYLHGIMHRREPDYANARYWFRRVGNHPVLETIATRLMVEKDLERVGATLVRNQRFDPFLFIDACEEVARRPDAALVCSLRQIQRIEMAALLARCSAGDHE